MGGWGQKLPREACATRRKLARPICHPQHAQNKNERANPNAQEHSRPHTTTQGPRSPKKQKQRVNHSRGEPSLNAEDGGWGRKNAEEKLMLLARVLAPHLPSGACADSRTNERTRTLKNTQDRIRRPKERAPPRNKSSTCPLKRRTRAERGGWAGGVRSFLAVKAWRGGSWRAPSAIRSMRRKENERANPRDLDDPRSRTPKNAHPKGRINYVHPTISASFAPLACTR